MEVRILSGIGSRIESTEIIMDRYLQGLSETEGSAAGGDKGIAGGE